MSRARLTTTQIAEWLITAHENELAEVIAKWYSENANLSKWKVEECLSESQDDVIEAVVQLIRDVSPKSAELKCSGF